MPLIAEIKEANIIINGQECTDSESMTIRVALSSFLMDLNDNGLGDDTHGKVMTSGYKANIFSIFSKF
jgi:hypothetical protein